MFQMQRSKDSQVDGDNKLNTFCCGYMQIYVEICVYMWIYVDI